LSSPQLSDLIRGPPTPLFNVNLTLKYLGHEVNHSHPPSAEFYELVEPYL